jgi:hypothetical protein
MRREQYESICRGAGAGEEKFVQNLDSLYSGRVVACGEDRLLVEAFGHRYAWDAERCRPVSRNVNPLGPPTNI